MWFLNFWCSIGSLCLLGYINTLPANMTLDECFQNAVRNCVPRADAVYIRFESEPDDPWAIDQIEVDVSFQLLLGPQHRYRFHFEHPVLLPCKSWIDDRSTYQIGPRTGLFIKHSYSFTPTINSLVREWI